MFSKIDSILSKTCGRFFHFAYQTSKHGISQTVYLFILCTHCVAAENLDWLRSLTSVADCTAVQLCWATGIMMGKDLFLLTSEEKSMQPKRSAAKTILI